MIFSLAIWNKFRVFVLCDFQYVRSVLVCFRWRQPGGRVVSRDNWALFYNTVHYHIFGIIYSKSLS